MPAVLADFAPALILFALFVSYLAARGLLGIWAATFGRMFMYLAGALDFHVSVLVKTVHLDLGGPFKAANNAVVGWLQAWAVGAEISMAYVLHGTSKLIDWQGHEIASLAHDVADFGEHLIHVRLPRWAKYAVPSAAIAALVARLVRRLIPHSLHGVTRVVRSVVHSTVTTVERLPRTLARRLAHDERRIAKLAAAIAAAAGTIALPFPRVFGGIRAEVRGLARWAWRVNRRLRRLELLFGVTGMAAAMANVFGLPNWRCLTRGNVGRLMRSWCGLDKALVDLLLVGTFEAFALSDLCDLVGILNTTAKALEPELLTLVSVEGALIGCPHASYAKPLPLAAYDPTPAAAAIAV